MHSSTIRHISHMLTVVIRNLLTITITKKYPQQKL